MLDHLRIHGSTSVDDLSKALNASSATIRRDLDLLADEGLLERVWGGARLNTVDDAFAEAQRNQTSAKERIGRIAAEQISSDSTVILDIGTTVYAMTPHLRGRLLTIITPSLPVVQALSDCANIRLIVLGGDYSAPYQCTQGIGTVDALSHLSADFAFLGCSGVDARGNVRDTNDQHALVKRAMMRAAHSSALLVDQSKLPGKGSNVACAISEMSLVFTDAPFPYDMQAFCNESNTEVVVA